MNVDPARGFAMVGGDGVVGSEVVNGLKSKLYFLSAKLPFAEQQKYGYLDFTNTSPFRDEQVYLTTTTRHIQEELEYL